MVLFGHTDNTGSKDSNRAISKMRLESTVNYPGERGVNAEIIKLIAVGESQPV
ncbi:MAG: outer membrane protein OmpA-like peptidoglycan-associated protein [Vicingaceae bacterium]